MKNSRRKILIATRAIVLSVIGISLLATVFVAVAEGPDRFKSGDNHAAYIYKAEVDGAVCYVYARDHVVKGMSCLAAPLPVFPPRFGHKP